MSVLGIGRLAVVATSLVLVSVSKNFVDEEVLLAERVSIENGQHSFSAAAIYVYLVHAVWYTASQLFSRRGVPRSHLEDWWYISTVSPVVHR